MSEYIITMKQLAILVAKCREVKLVNADGEPICDSREIAEAIDKPVTLKEIVRCKDCAKWSFFDVEDGVRYGECAEFTAKVDSGCGHATRESGFCAWGERW